MKRKENTVRYTADEIDRLRRKGLDRTDWARVKATTRKELRESIAADPNDIHEPLDWTDAMPGIPPLKRQIKLRIDADVLEWFRATGRGYQTRMNSVLRTFFERQKSQQR